MEKVNIEQIGQLLLSNKKFIHKLRLSVQSEKSTPISSSSDLQELIEEIRELLQQLIRQQLQNELKQIIEDNNRILKQVEGSMIQENRENKTHQFAQDISFTEVHRLMNEEKKKLVAPQQANDASIEKSISAFVELKVETLQQRVINIDKRLKSMEDKYQTNLKSIWNVLSITESAIFDHLKQCKDNEGSCGGSKIVEDQAQPEKKSFFGGIFKLGK